MILISKLESYDTMHQKIKNMKDGQTITIVKQKVKKPKNNNKELEISGSGKLDHHHVRLYMLVNLFNKKSKEVSPIIYIFTILFIIF